MCWRSSVSRRSRQRENALIREARSNDAVETSDVPENMVVQVFQDGYLYHEKILRHAKVGVSKKPPTSESAPAETGQRTTRKINRSATRRAIELENAKHELPFTGSHRSRLIIRQF